MILEEALYHLNEDEIFGKREEIELEGSDFLGRLSYLRKTLNEVIDEITKRDTMLCEDVEIIDKTQRECIEKLGEILDRLNTI